MGTGFQPEHRKELLELATQRHGVLIEKAQFEESCICFEAVCHFSLVYLRIARNTDFSVKSLFLLVPFLIDYKYIFAFKGINVDAILSTYWFATNC